MSDLSGFLAAVKKNHNNPTKVRISELYDWCTIKPLTCCIIIFTKLNVRTRALVCSECRPTPKFTIHRSVGALLRYGSFYFLLHLKKVELVYGPTVRL